MIYKTQGGLHGVWVWYFSLMTMKMPCLPVLPMIWSHLEFACRLSWAQQSKCASMHQFFTVDLWNEVGHSLQHMYMILLLTLFRSICIQKCCCCPSKKNYSIEPHTKLRWLSLGDIFSCLTCYSCLQSFLYGACLWGRERAKKTIFLCCEEPRNFIYQLYPVNILLS